MSSVEETDAAVVYEHPRKLLFALSTPRAHGLASSSNHYGRCCLRVAKPFAPTERRMSCLPKHPLNI
jgi:hypothetical protein